MSEQDERIDELEDKLDEAKTTINGLENDLVESRDALRNLMQQFTPNVGDDEPPFHERVRDVLNLDWSTRDEKIFEELRRLKRLDERVAQLECTLDELQGR